MAVMSAKTHFERALATDMLDQVDKIMLRLQQEDDKETNLADAQTAEAEAAAAVKKRDFKAASAALTRARVAYKRAGGAATILVVPRPGRGGLAAARPRDRRPHRSRTGRAVVALRRRRQRRYY